MARRPASDSARPGPEARGEASRPRVSTILLRGRVNPYFTAMGDYYSERLAAERLKQVYDIAQPRVKQYLRAEIDYVLSRVPSGSSVLELGCGYGRVLRPLTGVAGTLIGVDTSWSSLTMAREYLSGRANCFLAGMDAGQLGFRDNLFDVTICIQNGISAFHLDQRRLIKEGLRVTRPGGQALFSTYSDRFWSERLAWFELQAEAGLVGEIDYERTGDGNIVCGDGFTASTVTRDKFGALTAGLGTETEFIEVDDSSLFCQLTRKGE